MKKTKLFPLIILLSLFLTSCIQHDKQSQWQNIPFDSASSKFKSVAEKIITYEGVLPCADCPGLKTKLIFYTENLTYNLSETYLEAENGKDATYNSSGKYMMQIGNSQNTKAVIYKLNPDSAEKINCYIVTSANTIEPAMKNGDKIYSPMSMTLTKK